MAKKFSELRARMSPEAQAKSEALTHRMLDELPLQELRQARSLSQEQLAEVLHVGQGAISRLERRTDMYISTLRSYIRAMGGELEITARFPDGSVRISQFEQIEEARRP